MTGGRIYVDLQNVDEHDFVVPTGGTRDDIADIAIELREGLVLAVYDMDAVDGVRDDLVGLVKARWDGSASRWTFEVLPETVRRESEVRLDVEAAMAEAFSDSATSERG